MPATVQARSVPPGTDHSKYRAPGTKELARVKAGPNLGQRDRSVPFKKPFVVAVLCTLVFYLALICLLAAAAAFVFSGKGHQHQAALILAALAAASVFSWIVAYLMRRRANCPLCKCTPLLDNFALKHQKAQKTWPLNHGHTAVVRLLCTQRWRCMYCGTPFDILKTTPREDHHRPPPRKKRRKSKPRR